MSAEAEEFKAKGSAALKAEKCAPSSPPRAAVCPCARSQAAWRGTVQPNTPRAALAEA